MTECFHHFDTNPSIIQNSKLPLGCLLAHPSISKRTVLWRRFRDSHMGPSSLNHMPSEARRSRSPPAHPACPGSSTDCRVRSARPRRDSTGIGAPQPRFRKSFSTEPSSWPTRLGSKPTMPTSPNCRAPISRLWSRLSQRTVVSPSQRQSETRGSSL